MIVNIIIFFVLILCKKTENRKQKTFLNLKTKTIVENYFVNTGNLRTESVVNLIQECIFEVLDKL